MNFRPEPFVLGTILGLAVLPVILIASTGTVLKIPEEKTTDVLGAHVSNIPDIPQTLRRTTTISTPQPEPHIYDQWFTLYGNEYGVSPDLLKRIAVCESRLDPRATNGIYAGLFQFAPRTWSSTRVHMGENADPTLRFEPSQSIRTAAFKIALQGTGPWPTCGRIE